MKGQAITEISDPAYKPGCKGVFAAGYIIAAVTVTPVNAHS